MIPNLPLYVSISFIVIAIYIVYAFIKSNQLKKHTLPVLISWSVFISILSYLGVYHYQEGDKVSRFLLILIPLIIFIVYLIRHKSFYEHRDFRWSTAVHIVRFPVEFLLYKLALEKWIPIEMTFEGWNFDIILGITAIILVVLLNFKKVNRKLLLYWNVLGLIFILFIFSNGFLSQELFYKNFGYAVPNRGITYFPIILLAGVIVPIVVYTHITDILLLNRKQEREYY